MRHSLAILIAVVIAVLALPTAVAQKVDPAEVQLKAAIRKEVVDGDLKAAITEFQRLVNTPGVSRAVAATALLRLGQCHEKLGNAEAQRSYERVLKEYPDQADVVRQARDRLATFAQAKAFAGEAAWGRRIVGPAVHQRGAVSPDGKYVAYCCLVIREVTTGREQRLSVELVGTPRFSPDGEHIAYVVRKSDGSLELQVVRRSALEPRVLIASPEATSFTVVDWTPDGNEVLVRVARQDKSTELAVVPFTGGASRRVMAPAPFFAGVDEGRLSPDGRYLLYRAQVPGVAGTWNTRVCAIDGSSDAVLIEHPANAWNIGWTTDGRFAFYSAEPRSEGIWTVKVAAGKAQELPERVSGKLDDSVRPVGLTRGGAFFYHKWTLDAQVRLMTVVPGVGTLKPSLVLNDATAPGWSPDGRLLAYAESRSGLIAIRTVATGVTRTLWTGLPGAIMALQWLPDGGALAAQGPGSDGSMASIGLRRVDLTSGSRSDILVGPAWRQFGANPTFSGNATTLTYKSFDDTQRSFLTRDHLETNQHDVLMERKPPQFVSSFSVLTRTGQIAVAVQETEGSSSIGVLDPSSKDVRVIHRTPKGDYIPASVSLAWMPDGQSILFVTAPSATSGSPMSLFRIPVSGGKPEKLFEAELIFQVRVHPDGGRIALDTRSYRMETFAVDNLLAGAKK